MTLQELKDKKIVFSNIKDNELIHIFNEVLSVKPEVKTMNHNFDNSSINRVIYSKNYIDWYIEKVMSSQTFSKSYKCEQVLKNLRIFLGRASKLSGFGKEIAYLNENIMKFERIKALTDEMDSSLDRNMDTLINLNPKDVSKLNKEALAIYFYTQLEQFRVALDDRKKLEEKILELVSENKKLSSENMDLRLQVDALREARIEEKKEVKIEEKTDTVVHEDVNSGDMDRLEVEDGRVKIKPAIGPVDNGPMQTLFPENSIRYLRNHNAIPSNISEDEIIRYCNDTLKFNPKLVDYRSVLTTSQINLLSSSNLVSNAKMKENMVSNHKSVLEGYKGLIENYEAMLDNIGDKEEFSEEVSRIRETLKTLRGQYESYGKTIERFGVQNVDQYLGFGISNSKDVSKSVSNVSKSIVQSQERKLNELDKEIAELTKEKEKIESFESKFGLTKMRQNFDTKVLNVRIAALKKKQGKMMNRQNKIISANTALYRARMEREFNKYSKRQDSLAHSIETKNYQLERQHFKQRKLDELNLKIKRINKQQKTAIGLDSAELRVEEVKSKVRKKMLEESIKRLQDKTGNVNISQQYQSTFNEEISYAL